MSAGRNEDLIAAAETRARYPRGWARNVGFPGWKIAVAVAGLLGVPATIFLLFTVLFR